MKNKSSIHQKQSELGNAVLEFALGFSVFLLLFAGVFQYGYTMYVYNALMTSVTNAAQMGAKLDYDTASPSTFTSQVQNMVLYGDISAGTTAIIPGLAASNINISVNPADSMPTDVTITIQNFSVDAVFTKFAFNGKPRVTAVYMGQIKCSTC